MIMGLTPTKKRQLSLFDNNNVKHISIMQSVDKIHKRFGPHKIKLANQLNELGINKNIIQKILLNLRKNQ